MWRSRQNYERIMKELSKDHSKSPNLYLFISERTIAGFSVFEASFKLGTSLEGSVKATGNTL